MPLQVNDVVRAAVRQRSAAGTDIVNVYHFTVSAVAGTPDDEDALDAIAAYFDDAYSEIEAGIPNAQVPVDIKVDVVDLFSGVEQVVRNIGTIGWGTLYNPSDGNVVYALGVAAPIILRTLIGKVFGRKFIGQLTEGDMEGNELGEFLTGMAAFAAKLLGPVVWDVTTTLLPGVLSKKTAQFEPFMSADLPNEVYYQRRRAIRHGS